MKCILLTITIGIIRGVLFPDYRFGPNIIIIPFVFPALMACYVTYMVVKQKVSALSLSFWGFVSVLLSTGIGIVVYGLSVGWHYVTEDTESQAVFMATVMVQSVVYLIGLALCYFFAKRYNQQLHRTP
tara:strand:+ start:999 stop:1382 length:384 start_codon:yes stop_codon:yes gene_type:complete